MASLNEILNEQPVNLNKLRELSRKKGGFQTNQNRLKIWPKLLLVNQFTIPDYVNYIDPHRDDTQVKVDVERSLWNVTQAKEFDEEYRIKRRKSLSDIIMAILCRNNNLYYYQGFHDLASIFLLVLEDDFLTFACVESASRNYFIDYMNPDFDIFSKSMRLLFVILSAADSELYNYFRTAKMEPFFATSWLITWFAHDINDLELIARIFDVMLSSHPLYCFYICTGVLVINKEAILKVECDFAALHNFLLKISNKSKLFDFEAIIKIADKLFEYIPVEKLRNLSYRDKELLNLIDNKKIALFSKESVFHITTMDSNRQQEIDSHLNPLSFNAEPVSSNPSKHFHYKKYLRGWDTSIYSALLSVWRYTFRNRKNKFYLLGIYSVIAVTIAIALVRYWNHPDFIQNNQFILAYFQKYCTLHQIGLCTQLLENVNSFILPMS